MLELVDGKKELHHSYEDCDKLIRKAKCVSDKALIHFFKLIGLDPELFSHLFKIRILVDLDECCSYDELIAYYDDINAVNPELDNTIHLLAEYVDDILDAKNKDEMFMDLVGTLIHETIHANRQIIIHNRPVYPQYVQSDFAWYESYCEEFSHLIHDGEGDYCVLKIKERQNEYIVYTLDRYVDDFYVFSVKKDQVGRITSIQEMEDLLDKRIGIFKLIKTVTNPHDVNLATLVSDYSTTYENGNRLSRKTLLNADGEIVKQRGFEESITEAFARIIYYLKDKDKYDISELLKEKDTPNYVMLAYTLINQLDMDTIRWFFLSCYMEEYRNKFYELYGGQYFCLIDIINYAMDNPSMNLNSKRMKYDMGYIRSLKKSNN